MSNYCYRHGQAWMSPRDASGNPSNFDIALPEIDQLMMNFTSEKIEHRSKRTSVQAKAVSAVVYTEGNGQLVISEHSADILKDGLYGNKAVIAGGAFSATNFEKTTIVTGDIVQLPGGKTHVSSLVITDSNGSPATLVLGTNYQIVDAAAGLVKFIGSLAGFTQPFRAAGTEAAGEGVGILTTRVFERHLKFKGINILNNDKVEVLDLYNIQPSPMSEWMLMGDGTDVQKVAIDFSMLIDTTKAADATFGQFGRLRM